jgi:hypothetical protein
MPRFLVIIASLVFLMGVGACALVGLRLKQPVATLPESILMVATDDTARQAAEAYFAITLPPAPVTDLFYLAHKQNDYWIRFNVQPEHLHGLLADSPRLECNDLDLLNNLRPEFAYAERLVREEQAVLSWWTPGTARTFVGSDCVGADLTSYKLLADTTNGATWTVYLEITIPQVP